MSSSRGEGVAVGGLHDNISLRGAEDCKTLDPASRCVLLLVLLLLAATPLAPCPLGWAASAALPTRSKPIETSLKEESRHRRLQDHPGSLAIRSERGCACAYNVQSRYWLSIMQSY